MSGDNVTIKMSIRGIKSLTQRSYLGAVGALLAFGTSMAIGFVTNPILISLLGTNSFGIWQICRRLLSYVSAGGGRATEALTWKIASSTTLSKLR